MHRSRPPLDSIRVFASREGELIGNSGLAALGDARVAEPGARRSPMERRVRITKISVGDARAAARATSATSSDDGGETW